MACFPWFLNFSARYWSIFEVFVLNCQHFFQIIPHFLVTISDFLGSSNYGWKNIYHGRWNFQKSPQLKLSQTSKYCFPTTKKCPMHNCEIPISPKGNCSNWRNLEISILLLSPKSDGIGHDTQRWWKRTLFGLNNVPVPLIWSN